MAMLAIAKMLGGFRVEGDGNALAAFADREAVSAWAVPAVEASVSAGLVNGRSADRLEPQGYVTRAEAAVMIHRFLRNFDLI
jgi:hypothetical protein